jgi:beta-galactosidase
MQVGVDYYPEQWDSAIWEQDAREMKAVGVSVVRLAEFAWSRLEPVEGSFDFAWLDQAIATLGAQGIKIVIGTPTATPPNWLVEKHPDVLPLDNKRQPMYPGVRLHRCYNSPSLRKHTEIIVRRLTEHFGKNPHVIGWQTDNEMIGNDSHSDAAIAQFRTWLQQRYGDLATLNRTWGTVVWSGEYSSWTQVNTPLGGSPYQNPSFLLDYQRFCSDSVANFNRFQAALIREHCPHQFITHNLWGYPVTNDYYDLFDSMDFVSVDYYPATDLKNDGKAQIYHGAMTLDLTRGVKRKNFWVMEQLSGTPGCWHPMSRTPRPGMVRAHAWQSVSRGADTVVHFRWRTARIGAEQFWHGLLDHHGKPGRRFAEFATFSDELSRLSPLLDGSTLVNEVAMLFSHEQLNALNIQPQSDGFNYLANFKRLHHALLAQGVGTDVINWRADFSGYKLVVAPYLYLMDEAMRASLTRYVEAGGTLVLTTRSGVKTMHNVCQPEMLPGLLSGLAGCVVEEYDPVGRDAQRVSFNGIEGLGEFGASQWCDVLAPTAATTLATYASEFFAGRAAVTQNQIGAGTVVYIGTVLDDAANEALFARLLDQVGIEHAKLPEGVQTSVRTTPDGKRVRFVLNLSAQAQTVTLPDRPYTSALDGGARGGSIALAAMDVEILIEG